MNCSLGTLTLMGSGEMTSSMVSVHRHILDRIKERPIKSVFLDTPAGFQLNADLLSEKAAEYFHVHFQTKMVPVFFKSAEKVTSLGMIEAAERICKAHLIFAGPGSPTYALDNWRNNTVGNAIRERLYSGGHLVFASAASVTVGRFALPVYEIYKVGQAPFWAEGLNLLRERGLDLAIVPHWNNAEGGNHDTSCCYMGKPRMATLENILPKTVVILGIDEHTACVIDLEREECRVMGAGQVVIRYRGEEREFSSGATFSLEELQSSLTEHKPIKISIRETRNEEPPRLPFEDLQRVFFTALMEKDDVKGAALTLVDLAKEALPSKEIGKEKEKPPLAPEILIEMLKVLSGRVQKKNEESKDLISSLIETLISLRNDLRASKQWSIADKVRKSLASLGVKLEDSHAGTHWRIEEVNRKAQIEKDDINGNDVL